METDPGRTNGRVTEMIEDAERARGEWNHLVIHMQGGLLQVTLNERLVNEIHGVGELPGAIAIKSENVEIHYRNVSLTPLD